MEQYVPPFIITNTMLMLVAEIADKAGRITAYRSFETKLHLRRNNRIRSIHSSLAIEANFLSLDEVRSVINGKTVIGPEKEIQEVKNAYQRANIVLFLRSKACNRLIYFNVHTPHPRTGRHISARFGVLGGLLCLLLFSLSSLSFCKRLS